MKKTLLTFVISVFLSTACGGSQRSASPAAAQSDCHRLVDHMFGIVKQRLSLRQRSAFEDKYVRERPTLISRCKASNMPPAKMQCALNSSTPREINRCVRN